MTGRSGTRDYTRSMKASIRAFDVASFLARAGSGMEQQGTQLAGECPLCRHHRVSFYIHPTTKFFKCHYCGEGGGLVKLVAEVTGDPYDLALRRILTQNVWAEFDPDEEEQAPKEITIKLPRAYEPLRRRTEGNRRFWRYAKTRGIDERTARRYRIGYCRTGRYRSRLIVPVFRAGILETFVARDITGTSERKVLTPRGNTQSSTLFNLEQVWGRKEVVIVEGVFDALALPDRAVATFGKKLSREQAALLHESGVRTATFCWDADAAGEQAKYARTLDAFFEVRTAALPAEMDPSNAPPAVLRRAVKTASAPSLAAEVRSKLRR